MNDKPYTATMVSQTHWDRAWYLPFQVFRMRLVRLVDRVIDILDRDPEFRTYMLDGQMLPIEDYLELRPERRADLERLVRAGRLWIGPWYALADEYLVSPESLIRNLMLGIRLAQELGGVMCEGYVPDAFGHIGQLPQLLKGFDIDSAIFWRGVGDEGEELGNEFWWEAPDGSRVLAVHLRDGYHNAVNLGYPMRWGDPSALDFDMERALRRLRASLDLLKPHAHTRHLLLMNGIDHIEADPRVPSIIARANEYLPDVHIEHGSLSDYIARVCAAAEDNFPTFQGELNRGRYAVSLQGVYSTRMYLKQANERVQTLLECYAEPLSSWAWLLGEDYPSAFLWAAWRQLLKNHPHDDICGCSVDQVHREMMTRFAEAEQIGSVIVRNSFRAMTDAIDRTAQPGVPFVMFNPLGWPRSGTVEVELHFDLEDDIANGFHLVDAAGRAVPCQVLDRHEHFDMEVLKANRKQAVRVAASLDALPACGYRVYYALPGQAAEAVEAPVHLLDGGMENRYLRVEIKADGTLDVFDKTTQRHYRGLGYFSDDEDAGDEYDYSPAPHGENISSLGGAAEVNLVGAGPLQATYQIRLGLPLAVSLTEDRDRRSEQRVDCPIVSTVTLRRDSRSVEFRTTVDNHARDHRLRACFPTDLAVDAVTVDASFDAITRPLTLPSGDGWAQPPVPTGCQRYFVDVTDGTAGLAVFNRGLPEYELLRDEGRNTLAITLLRCVDMISRASLSTRPGHAGIPCPAPEGQCLGQHTFEYAIRPHAGDWHATYHDAYGYRAPVYLRRGDEHEGYDAHETWLDDAPEELSAREMSAMLKPPDLAGTLPGEQSFLTLEPDTLVLSAVKRSETGDLLVVRFYNPTTAAVQATLRLFRPVRTAQFVNLNEDFKAELPVNQDGSLTVPVSGKQVLTVALDL